MPTPEQESTSIVLTTNHSLVFYLVFIFGKEMKRHTAKGGIIKRA